MIIHECSKEEAEEINKHIDTSIPPKYILYQGTWYKKCFKFSDFFNKICYSIIKKKGKSNKKEI